MGLCKCPKRKVTNQFCYEHRVNVCENCMVTNHPKCIVLSYLKWLQDGDYNPICELCSKKLLDEECVRLICYHVFHWQCLDYFARNLPQTTPTGYKCPSCRGPVFPPSNMVSPVADVLRDRLKNVNWARRGLGMPLLADDQEEKPAKPERLFVPISNVSNYEPPQVEHRSSETVVHVEESNNVYNKKDRFDNVPRRLTHTSDTQRLLPSSLDHDENKYNRRTIVERFNRWHRYAKNSRYFHFYYKNKYRRYFIIAVLLFLIFFFFMLLVERLSSQSPYDDDPTIVDMQNLHIKIEES